MRALLPLLLLIAAGPAWAAESAPVATPRGTATIVSDTDRVEPGTPFQIGLRLRLAPGWHTYWKNPGDAGTAPELTVAAPAGTTTGALDYPVPTRQPEGPLMTYGYGGDVLLPMRVTPGPGPQRLRLDATWLACAKICVPEEGHFTLDLPQGAPTPSAEAPLFTGLHLPLPAPFDARTTPGGMLLLSGRELSPATVADAWFIPDADGAVVAAARQTVSVGDGEVRLGLQPAAAFAAGPLEGLVTLKAPGGQETSYQIAAPLGAVPAGLSFGQAILFALLGGAILNLMPCVFPILAMKAVGLARLSGRERTQVRSHAGAYALGVVATFTALGGLLLALRAAGGAQGWGFQFQSPVAVALMAWLLFVVGLNLSGVYEVPGRLAGIGQGLAARDGHAGSFFTGALAVLVATPCTAPFMAAAIAAALALPATLTLVVFAALGTGLAAPYLLLALAPSLARFLPRPGAWMATLRGLLAFPMYAAAIWLLWVASLQAGDRAIPVVGGGGLLLGLGAWALGQSQRRPSRAGPAVALAAALAAVALLVPLAAAPPSARAEGAEAFTPARLAALREQGRPVFVNMTAAWCVTCLVNERLALSPAPVRAAFERHRVAYLKGDWTSGDKTVTEFLRTQGRDGVPLYALYLPGRAEPLILPQILTEAGVLAALGDVKS